MRSAFKKVAKKLSKDSGQKNYGEKAMMCFFKNFNKKSVIAVEPCKNLASLTKKLFKTYDEF